MNLYTRLLQLLGKSGPVAAVPSADPEPADRRRTPRCSVDSPARIILHGHRFNVRLRDVSLGGLRVMTRFEPNVTAFDVELEVAGRRMDLPARIVRRDFEHGVYHVGARFADLSGEQQEHLQRFVEAHSLRHRSSVA